MRTNTNNMVRTLKALPKDNYIDIVERYQEVFTELAEMEAKTETVVGINTFAMECKKQLLAFKTLSKYCRNFIISKRIYMGKFRNIYLSLFCLSLI